MSSNAIKIIAVVFVVLAVILAIIGFRMSRNYAETATKATQQVQAQATVPQTQVVVATKPLLANQPITSDEVKLVPVQVAPQEYYANVDDVVNRVPLIDIDTGSPLTPRLFKENNLLAKIVPAGHKAVSLTLNDIIGVGGFVRPGDIVDVLVYLRNDQSNKVDPAQARILLKDALVLASDERIVSPPAGANQNAQQQQQQQRHERTVVVAVPDPEVTRVMLGANMGEIRLALHGQAPETQVASAQAQQPGSAAPAPTPAPVSAVAGAPQAQASPAAANADQQLPDQPFTSAELARLKPPRPAKGAPQGVVIYRGSKASTVYP